MITPNLWALFPKLLEAINYNIDKTCEYSCVSPGIMSIMNYMQKDSGTFMGTKMESGITPFDATVGLTSKCISNSHESADYLLHKTGTDLVVGLLENLFDKIDDFLCNIIELLVEELQKCDERTSKLLIMQAISMCFTYNPAMTFTIIEDKGWTQGIFETWFDSLSSVKYDFEIKRIVLGLTSIIS